MGTTPKKNDDKGGTRTLQWYPFFLSLMRISKGRARWKKGIFSCVSVCFFLETRKNAYRKTLRWKHNTTTHLFWWHRYYYFAAATNVTCSLIWRGSDWQSQPSLQHFNETLNLEQMPKREASNWGCVCVYSAISQGVCVFSVPFLKWLKKGKINHRQRKNERKKNLNKQNIDRGVPLKYQIKNMKKANSQIFSSFRRKEHLCVARFSFF